MKNKMQRMALLLGCAAMLLGTGCNRTPVLNRKPDAETEPASETTTLSPSELESIALEMTVPDAASNAQEDSGETPQPTASPTEFQRDPNEAQPDFGTAVFLSKMGEDEERYFFFYGNTSGAWFNQKDGASTSFTYDYQPTSQTVFHINGQGDAAAERYWLDGNTLLLTWSSGLTETLTRMPNDPNQEFTFYSSDALCQLALSYYEKTNGMRPQHASAMINYDETIAIHLYDDDGSDRMLDDWYTVSRYTAQGIDHYGVTIDLNQPPEPASDSAEETPAPAEQPTEPATEPPTEPVTEPPSSEEIPAEEETPAEGEPVPAEEPPAA